MRTDITLEAVTGGRFRRRHDADGEPTRFEVDGDAIRIHRGAGVPQEVDTASGLGLVALCARDGRVLGYGTLDVEDLPALADDADAALGAMEGTPLERLAAHDITLVLPLDAMPAPVRDLFLAPIVPAGLVVDAGLDDAMIAQVTGGHGHDGHEHDHRGHGHAPGEECAACASPDGMDELWTRIDRLVAQSGHAVISVHPRDGRPGVSYSVGLSEVGWPEIVVTGLVGDQGVLVVNAAIGALRAGERRPADGVVVEGAVSVPLRLRAIDVEQGRLHSGVASERHARTTGAPAAYQVLQLLWPDGNGVFPDEPGYDGTGLPQQTLIGRRQSREGTN